jgi:hypothetical protein
MTTRSGRSATDRGRLERDRRHRRRQLLRPPRLGARPRGAGARQQRLFPRPRGADAARELSADICSLKEGEDRAAMACHLQIAKDGSVKKLALHARQDLRIAANIAYEDAQAAIDAAGEEGADRGQRRRPARCRRVEGRVPRELVEKALKPLWACWRALVRGAATSASRSSSTCPSAGWCSTRRAGSCRSRRASGSTRTGWSRII